MTRRHRIAAFLIILILSPYLLAFVLLYAAAYAAATLADILGGRR